MSARTIITELVAVLKRLRLGGLSRRRSPQTATGRGARQERRAEWVTKNRRDRREREHAESFDRLLPNAGDNPKGADFEALRQTCRNHMKPVKSDRDWNRAHPFDTPSA